MAVSIGLLLEVDNITISQAFAVVATSTLGLWAASCFAEYVSYRVIHDRLMPKKDIAHMLAAHRGIIVAGLPALILIAAAWLSIASLRTVFLIDIVLAVVVMTIIILRSANTRHNTLLDALIMIAVQAGIALFIIWVKLFGH